ncbi:hypothetical protein SAMN05421676_104326 [Salinibacillus kushneri]|uniref:Uncharacterized protein n=1 Tax=Salinibacillus kushneri TaxID=237682 RepID=A0A1I0E8D0_9BACI|nr:hypothetical protein [Salinibacillus kushneri]SET40944.1 hypothetical protein SAMN05421676_104326 [Salinibacillus kushneri]
MSWKAVEMQIALPRTQDAGQIQNQLDQRSANSQHYLAQVKLHEEEQRRKKVNELRQKEQYRLQNGDSSAESAKILMNNQEMVKRLNRQQQKHPFLGNRFDING